MPGSGGVTGGGEGVAQAQDRTVTMHDIARAAGVSQSTVSRVLNDTSTAVPIAAPTRSGSSTSPIASATGPTHWPVAYAAPRRC